MLNSKANTGRRKPFTIERLIVPEAMLTLGVIILMLIIAAFEPRFLRLDNIISLFRATSVYMIMLTGMTFVIISSGIDLSIGAVSTFGSIFTARLLLDLNCPLLPAIVLGIFFGAMLGLVSGISVSYFALPAFMVTFAVGGVARGLNLFMLGGKVYSGFSDSFMWLGRGLIGNLIPVPVIIGLIVLVLGHLVLFRTRFGVYVRAIGGNQTAAQLTGINVEFYKTITYVLMGALAAFAGIVLMARSGSIKAVTGEPMVLHTIASVIIGGTSLHGGKGTIYGSFIGAFLFSILTNVIVLTGIGSLWHQVIVGVVVILTIGGVSLKEGLRKKKTGESLF